MDALERLRQAGEVERVDEAVLESALRKLAEATGADTRLTARRQSIRPRSWRVAASAMAAVLAAAAVFAAVAWLGHSVPASRRPTARPAAQSASSQGSPTMAAVLTAFSASRNDILMITKIVRGEGTCCKTIMWVSPAGPAPGTTVRTRIQNFTVGGSRLSDAALSYTAPATAPPASRAGCDDIFLRPKAVAAPASGVPGTLVQVDYAGRLWVKGSVRVQSATLPSAVPLRACLAGGQWREAGRRMLAGAKAIELVSLDGIERLWVSAATFLPVRLTSISPTPYGPTIITFAFKFLAPTAANQAALAPPPIPSGFSRQDLPG